MKSKIILISVVFSLLIISSCRRLVESEFPLEKQELIVNSVIAYPDSSITVFVSLTHALHEKPAPAIKNAIVLMKCNDNDFVQLLYNSEKNAYELEHVVQQGDSYECKVFVPGFDTVYAQQTVPYANNVLDVKFANDAIIGTDGFTYSVAEVTFDVNNDTINYYEMLIYIDDFSISLIEEQDDKVLLAEGLNQLLFSNKLIDSCKYTLKANMGISGNALRTLLVELRTVTPEYYKYKRSCELSDMSEQANSDAGILINYIPTYSVYSNIENGRGSFVSYAANYSDTLFLNINND